MRKKAASLILAALAFLGVCVAPAPGAAEQFAVVRIWNWNIHDKKHQQSMYKLFNLRNPDVRIEYSSISNTVYDQTLEAALVAQDPPDLFLPAGKYSFSYLRTKGLIMTLNDVAPSADELADWMSHYPPLLARKVFMEGTSVFDGEVYIVQLTGESNALGPGFPLFYNKTLFREAGVSKPPATQSELRKTGAKITQAGQGRYFGIVRGLKYVGGGWWFDLGGSLAYAAGVGGGPYFGLLDLKDGRFHLSGPEFTTALKLWIGMNADGSVYPGDMLMEDEQAKMTFTTNKAAFVFGGDWNVSNHYGYNPDADFDVVLPPTPDDGIRRGFGWITDSGGAFGYLVSSTTRNPRAVWKVIGFLSSLEYQEGWVKGGYGVSYLPEANRAENQQYHQMYTFVQRGLDPSLSRVCPTISAGARRAFLDLMPGIYPTYQDVMAAIYLGKAGFDALADLDKREDAALDEAIAKAQAEGFTVSRADFAFPDWDRMKDYLPRKK